MWRFVEQYFWIHLFQDSRISRTTKEILAEKKAEEDELDRALNASKARPVPDFHSTPAPVRLNVASILREDALYKKKQEEEARLIQNYESELRDSTEFIAWQTKMK